MKINVGCGSRTLDGWFNCDIEQNPDAPRPVDLLCDAKSIPLPDESADTLQAIHIFEHCYKWECDDVIEEWKRLLKPGGLLIIEMPDLLKVCKNILDGAGRGGKHPDQLGMWGGWGDPRTRNPYMTHKWLWSPQTIEALLRDHGFIKITHRPTQYHPAGRAHRDLRVEARKPRNV